MERIASAYGRALYPRRYGPRDGLNTDGGEPMALPPGSLELAVGAGIYHLVVTVDGWLDGLRQRLARWRTRPARSSSATPVGCG